MTLQIELTPEQEGRLAAAARRRGVAPAHLAQQLVAEHLPLTDAISDADAAVHPMTPQETIRALDEIAQSNRHLPVLPSEAFDRETLYDERL